MGKLTTSEPMKIQNLIRKPFVRTVAPDYFILGAQKAGTTSLFSYLAQCPSVFAPSKKEIAYFSKDVNYHNGKVWYLQHFPKAVLPGMRGFCSLEATPEYFYYPFVASRIKQYNKRSKFIVLLREPVSRAFSAWNMFRQFKEKKEASLALMENGNYYDQLKTEILSEKVMPDMAYLAKKEIADINAGNLFGEPSFVKRGLYYYQFENYFNHFPRKNFLILQHEKLKTDLHTVLHEVSDFMHIKNREWIQKIKQEDQNVRDYTEKPDFLTELHEFYKPYNTKLENLLNMKMNWQ